MGADLILYMLVGFIVMAGTLGGVMFMGLVIALTFGAITFGWRKGKDLVQDWGLY